ncbi:uncharacterized protein [Leptinotarsa decemlineata]|uniref:uncharacterized protein n=1 Tax=Leptinotarsa decemlineata TaxID=7539 RepID=UPI003D307AFF
MSSRARKILNLLKNEKQEEKSLMNQDHSSFVAETSSLKENYDALNCDIMESSTDRTDSVIASQVFIVQADGSLVEISNAVTSTDTTTVIAIDSLPPLYDSMIPSEGISYSNVVPNVTEETNVGVIEENTSNIDSTISRQVSNVIEETINGIIEENTSIIIDSTVSLQVPNVIEETNNGFIEENTSLIDSSVSQANENENTINIAGDNIKEEQIVSPKRRRRHKVNERKWESKKAKKLLPRRVTIHI